MCPSISLRTIFIAGNLCLFTAGCDDSPAIRQYVVQSENEKKLTSDLLRREFTPIPFRLDIPSTWKLASNDQFSLRAWTTGPPVKPARITLGRFPGHSGIPAQVQRWRRQLGLDQISDDEAMKNVAALRTQNGVGSFATVGGESETILAFILPMESNYWIFRFRGTNKIAKANSDVFHRFCESLDYVKPPAKMPTRPNVKLTRDEAATETEEAVSNPPMNTESENDGEQSASESSEEGEE